jgi:hypothetical protein
MKAYVATHVACALMCAGTLYLTTKFYMPLGLVLWVYGAWVAVAIFMTAAASARRTYTDLRDVADVLWYWLAYAVVYFVLWLVTGGLMAIFFGLHR